MVIPALSARRFYTLNEMQKSLIDTAALRLLACPVCHAGLTLVDPETVLCTACGRRYPMRDGLPVLLVVVDAQQ